jgi:chemotaxis protein MotA
MNKKFELSTVLGIFIALLLIISAITAGSSISSFFDFPSVLIVLGGTFFISCACFSIADVIKALSTTSQSVLYAKIDKKKTVQSCLKISELSRREGLLAIQKKESLYKGMGTFFKKHLMAIVDGLSAEESEKLMLQEILYVRERHKRSVEVLKKAAEVAPAMGLVGTLIGLVQMLGALEDPSKIGPAMAVALLTTLYGAIIAYVILLPLANKLERNSRDEIEVLKIYAEGIVAIAKNEGPLKFEMRMNANLSPEERIKVYS